MLIEVSDINLSNSVEAMLIVCAALLLEKFVAVPSSVNPLAFYRFICLRMSHKVHKDNDRQQALIAGSLSYLVLCSPIILIYYLVHEFAGYAWLLDILVMFLLLSYSQDAHIIKRSATAIAQEKKQLAKSLLQTKVLRETNNLSALGIFKACEESLLIRYHHQQFCTIFCFLALGPLAAIAYRLAYESHQVWNTKLQKFSVFGSFTKYLLLICQLISSLLFSLSFILLNHPIQLIRSVFNKDYWYYWFGFWQTKPTNHFFLYTLSLTNEVDTGGPVMYGGVKVRRKRFPAQNALKNSKTESNIKSVNNLINRINRHLISSLLVITALLYWISLS